jgi:hypothetical protein
VHKEHRPHRNRRKPGRISVETRLVKDHRLEEEVGCNIATL